MSTAPLAGVVLLTRHGDRQGFYQNPKTYTAAQTNLTVLGYLQEYQNGQDLRNLYLTGDNAILGIDSQKAEPSQLNVLADAGGEGGVIVDSANALLQGLYPPFNESLQLANGSTVTWPSRAQLIQIETIEPDQEVWLEGWTDCDSWQDRLNKWYESEEFKSQASIANPFYESLSNVLGNRPKTLENAWNLFDFLNVEYIHNSTLSQQIGENNRKIARYWANYHEAGSFSAKDPNDVGNIAGQAILPPLLDGLSTIANTSQPLKFTYLAASYKPFLSLFGMMKPQGLENNVVDYASAAIFEVRTDSTLRFLFRNGTEGDFIPYNILNSSTPHVSLTSFKDYMQPFSLQDRAEWCDKCSTTDARGCQVLASLNGTGNAGYSPITSTNGHHRVSPVVAGVIGALVSLAVAAVLLAAWLFFGGMVKKSKNGNGNGNGIVKRGNNAGSSGFELPHRDNASSIGTAHESQHSLTNGKGSES